MVERFSHLLKFLSFLKSDFFHKFINLLHTLLVLIALNLFQKLRLLSFLLEILFFIYVQLLSKNFNV